MDATVERTQAGHRWICDDVCMKGFLIKTVVNGVALWIAAWAITGIHLGEDATETSTQIITIALVALLFGVINAVVKPVATFLAIPAIIITLGLFTLIVNAAMLWLTSWLAGPLGLDFAVDTFFWDAVLGAIVITIVSMILNSVVPEPRA